MEQHCRILTKHAIAFAAARHTAATVGWQRGQPAGATAGKQWHRQWPKCCPLWSTVTCSAGHMDLESCEAVMAALQYSSRHTQQQGVHVPVWIIRSCCTLQTHPTQPFSVLFLLLPLQLGVLFFPLLGTRLFWAISLFAFLITHPSSVRPEVTIAFVSSYFPSNPGPCFCKGQPSFLSTILLKFCSLAPPQTEGTRQHCHFMTFMSDFIFCPLF